MKTFLDCVACFIKQALEHSRVAGADENVQLQVIKDTAKLIENINLGVSPPELGRLVYKAMVNRTGVLDPYRELKEKSINEVLNIYDKLKNKIKSADDQLAMAIELAIAGNIIDFGVTRDLNLSKEIDEILKKEKQLIANQKANIFDLNGFKKKLNIANTILFLGDNAGESVFDKLLIEEIKENYPKIKFYYAVRENPIINDVILEDAINSGLHEVAEVLSSGSDAPGTVWELCNDKFKRLYQDVDIVISKGQGNYESVSQIKLRPVFYLFIAKCQIVARDAEVKEKSIVFKYF